MKSNTSNQMENSGTVSDGHARLVIRYLDPEWKRKQRQFACAFAGLVALLIWTFFIGLLFALN